MIYYILYIISYHIKLYIYYLISYCITLLLNYIILCYIYIVCIHIIYGIFLQHAMLDDLRATGIACALRRPMAMTWSGPRVIGIRIIHDFLSESYNPIGKVWKSIDGRIHFSG